MTAPAQRLRDAARGMREKAEAATPGPWGTWAGPRRSYVEARDAEFTVLVETCPKGTDADIAYIAAMSPPVALALAEWLEHEADSIDFDLASGLKERESVSGAGVKALAVADAFLGVEHE